MASERRRFGYRRIHVMLNRQGIVMNLKKLTQARADITEWKEDYSRNRPHSSLGNITPSEFAMKMAMEKQAA